MDMSAFIIAKSDQLNSDDLMSGPRTVTITSVRGAEGDQPVAVNYEGDGGKPFKPCKSMRRVMVACWGKDASKYAGRSMTLYRDPDVAFGGMKVGGIRISHMSHIDGKKQLALTATRGKKAPFTVQPLTDAPKLETKEEYGDQLKLLRSVCHPGAIAELERVWSKIGPDARKALAGELSQLKKACEPEQQQTDPDDVPFDGQQASGGASYDGV